MLGALVVFGFAVSSAFAAYKVHATRVDLLARPVLTVAECAERGVVHGEAAGTPITSPWTGNTALVVSASERTEYRDRDGDRRTRSRELGTEVSGDFGVADGDTFVAVHAGTGVQLRHLRRHRRPMPGFADLTEEFLDPGERVWVSGELNSAETVPVLGGEVTISAAPPDHQAKVLRWWFTGAVILSAVLFVASFVVAGA